MEKKIFEIILNSSEPVSNRDLALNCKVSINTIRKEINLLNERLSQYGMCIVSQPSVGNYIEIIDSHLAIDYINKFRELYKRNKRMKNDISPSISYLVRKYLSATQPFTIDSLCQELYCSKGTLLKDIEVVKEILRQFDLTLHNRNRSGLVVEGNEWNIRQCLIYQHKVYKNSFELHDFKEADFNRLFLDKISNFNIERDVLMDLLCSQKDFTLPMIIYPKIIHYMQLSYTRRNFSANMKFTDEQVQRVLPTAEYQFARKLYTKFCERLNIVVSEQDVLALSMLLLSFESKNYRLKELDEYAQHYQETMELIDIFVNQYGCARRIFSDDFIEDFTTYLYTLKNRMVFNVYVDQEMYEEVEKKGIRSADFCIVFARLYEKNHGITLKREDSVTAFYHFHTALKKEQACYYSQNVLVISHYGVIRAQSIAKNIQLGYGKEVNLCTPIELGEMVEDIEDYDLLLTDVGVSQFHYLKQYDLPIISMDFSFKYRCATLDDYLKKVRQHSELGVISESSFVDTHFRNKEDVFEMLSDKFTCIYTKEDMMAHLRKNDELMGLERNYGVACLPILKEFPQQIIKIFVNDEPFVWNQSPTQIIVCYNRVNTPNGNQILNNILERFVHIKREKVEELLQAKDKYLQVLYSGEDFIK